MLASGAITADQLTAVLSSAGYEGQIEHKKSIGFVPQTVYTLEAGELTNLGTEEQPFMYPSSITMRPHTEKHLQIIDVPYLAGATQKGGVTEAGAAPGNIGGSGGGGGGGKKGGGGGGGKSYTAKNKDYSKKEKDRYEKVNTALDKIDSTLKNIEMDQDRLISNR